MHIRGEAKISYDHWMSRSSVELSLRTSLFAARRVQVYAFNRPTVGLSLGDGWPTGELRRLILGLQWGMF